MIEAFPKVMETLSYIEKSSRYKSWPVEKQQKVRGMLYDKYIVPSFNARGLKAPPKDQWVAKKFKPLSSKEPFYNFALAGVVNWAAKTGERVLGLADHVDRIFKDEETAKNSEVSKWIRQSKENSKAMEERTNAYVADNAATISDKVFWEVGKEAPNLPLYGMVGKALRAGEAFAGVEELFSSGKITPFAAKFLHDTADWYLINRVVSGEGHDEAIKSALTFGALSQGKVAYKAARLGGDAARDYIKKLFATGGAELVKAAFKHGETLSAKEAAKPGSAEEVAHQVEDYMRHTSSPTVLINHKVAGPVRLSTAVLFDKLGQAAVKASNDIAREMFGSSNFNLLKPEQKTKVYEHIIEVMQKAGNDIIHQAPQLTEKVIKEQVQEQVTASPIFAQTVETFKKLGIDITKENTEAAIERSAVQSDEHKLPAVLERISRGATSETEKTVNWLAALDRMNGERPGATTIDSPMFEKNLLKAIRANLLLESVDAQKVFAWSMRKDAPPLVKDSIEQMLYSSFPGKTSKDFNKAAKRLNSLITRVTIALNAGIPEVTKHGEKVFRSHNAFGVPNRWEVELNELLNKEGLWK